MRDLSSNRPPRTPTLRRHKASSLGIVTIAGKDHYLGSWPAGRKRPPADVQAAYDRLIAEWLANGRRLQPAPSSNPGDGITVNEVILAYWRYAETYYRRPDGTHTNELAEYRYSLKPLKELYGTTPAAELRPLKLEAVRQRMIDADWSRALINRRVWRIIRVMKWAASKELVPVGVYQALATIESLAKGRSAARETEPVLPIAEAHVYATLPHATSAVAALIELQLVTGMRPGEARTMRGCDLDTTGDVWLYKPPQHKTAHRGKERVIAIGPRGQAIVKPHLKLDTQAYLFSPREAVEQSRIERRAKRKSKVQPSQQNRRKRRPNRQPGDCYTASSYAGGVLRAVLAANTAAACDACKKLAPKARCEPCRAAAIPHWHPHQIRHTHATEVRRRFGLEAAQVALGHAQASVTQVYAERDLTLAAKVAREIG